MYHGTQILNWAVAINAVEVGFEQIIALSIVLTMVCAAFRRPALMWAHPLVLILLGIFILGFTVANPDVHALRDVLAADF